MGKANRNKRERVNVPAGAPGTTRGRPGWLLVAAAAMAAIVLAVVLVLVLGGKSMARVWPADASMTGLLTTNAPWPANQEQLPGRLDALGLPELGQEGTVLHIHQHLDIYVNGKKVSVPKNAGIAQTFLSDLHTHDASGVLHVESQQTRNFYLGDFFGVWGVRLNARCIGAYCADAHSQLEAFVNGKRVSGDPRDIKLASHEEIVLAYGTPAQLPKPLPSSYPFRPGE